MTFETVTQPTFENGISLVKVKGRVYRKADQAAKSVPIANKNSSSWSVNKTEYDDEEDLSCKVSTTTTTIRNRANSGSTSSAPPKLVITNTDADTVNFESDEGVTAVKATTGQTTGFEIKMKVAPAFFKFLVGKKGATKNQIQKDTGAIVQIPSSTSTSQYVVIKGMTEAMVTSAKTRIEILIQSAMDVLDYTHFVCLPLISSPALQKRVDDFYDEMNANASKIKGFDKSLCVSTSKLHLTICMLKLYTEESLESAKKIMRELSKKIYDAVETRSVIARLSGLEIMNDDPSSVHVLYAKVHISDGRVQKLAEVIRSEFKLAGLISGRESEVDLKLHATLLNTRYRIDPKQSSSTSSTSTSTATPTHQQERIPFDATEILSKYGDRDFGEVKLDSVWLAQRGGKDPATGFYAAEEKIVLP
eukprot:TRINITY_DN12558_c0_g1_i1.p1 TRINITY_DN12558_c0_g1~~TRINITY_DN12558_c0_g1_i1.p1  ORF type:complete len:419 (+),score=105.98 TRINITY_DN12558_c0_g1_i1:96-1352(+)